MGVKPRPLTFPRRSSRDKPKRTRQKLSLMLCSVPSGRKVTRPLTLVRTQTLAMKTVTASSQAADRGRDEGGREAGRERGRGEVTRPLTLTRTQTLAMKTVIASSQAADRGRDEEGREGGREEGRGGREGGREGRREGRREGSREAGREGGKEGRREGGKEEGREGARDGGVERGRMLKTQIDVSFSACSATAPSQKQKISACDPCETRPRLSAYAPVSTIDSPSSACQLSM